MNVVIVKYQIFASEERPDFVERLEKELTQLGMQKSPVKTNSYTISSGKFRSLLYSFNSHMAKFKWHNLDELSVYYPVFQEIGSEAIPSLGKYDLKIKGYSIAYPRSN